MPSALTVTFVQSTILNAVANILAQLIDQRKSSSPFTLNTLALLQFVTYGIVVVPINFVWQRALEARYPGFPSRTEMADLFRCCCCRSRRPVSVSSLRSFFNDSLTSSASSSSFSKRKHRQSGYGFRRDSDLLPRKEKPARWTATTGRSGLHSFVMKFIFDQTVGSVMNIVLFIVLIHLLKGEGLRRVWELVMEDFPPIMVARLKYRPLVSTLMYTVVPVDRRVVFGSACGVIWGIYLSLYAAV